MTLRIRTPRLAFFLIIGLLLAACAGPATSGSKTITCDKVQAALGSSAAPSTEPDMAAWGFPRVAAKQRFTPGRELTITAERVAVTLPPDLYTEPLDFELLLGEESLWQSCVPAGQTVVAPYAFRAIDPKTGQRVARFDKTTIHAISDPRIGDGVTVWQIAPKSPPTGEAGAAPPERSGTTVKASSDNARHGWFVTVPERK